MLCLLLLLAFTRCLVLAVCLFIVQILHITIVFCCLQCHSLHCKLVNSLHILFECVARKVLGIKHKDSAVANNKTNKLDTTNKHKDFLCKSAGDHR